MSMSERQKQLRLQEHAREEDEKIVDVFNCVERLHHADLRKMIVTERGEWVLAKIPRRNLAPAKVSIARLLRALPKHIMACLLARQPAVPPDDATPGLTDCEIASASCFGHMGKALQLLCSLCDTAAQSRPLRVEVLLSQEFAQEVVDAVNLVLVAMAGPEAQRCLDAAGTAATMQEALDRAAMVPAALRALAYAFTAATPEPSDSRLLNWEAICEALLQHPRGAVLLDASFDAVRTLVLAVRAALTSPDSSDEDVYKLAFSAGGAMELLSYLCAAPLFYHRLMIHDPSGAAPLRLVLACLTLHDAPLAAPPYCRLPPAHLRPAGPGPAGGAPPPAAPVGPLAAFSHAAPPYTTGKGKGAAELLVARGFALVVLLAEFEEPSYVDQLFEHQDVTRLAHQVLDRAATYIAQVLLRPGTAQHPPAAGEPQMAINVLRAAELLCDDSNFKAGLVARLSREVAQLLCLDAVLFKARWCAGEEAVGYHSKDEILVNSISTSALEGVERLEKASKKLFAGGGKQLAGVRVGRQLALERAVLLFKLIGNLHLQPAAQAREGSGTAPPESFQMRLLAALRPNPAALALALYNMRQLQQLILPFGPPAASEAVELVADVDINLFADLITQLEHAQPQPPPVALPPPLQMLPPGMRPPTSMPPMPLPAQQPRPPLQQPPAMQPQRAPVMQPQRPPVMQPQRPPIMQPQRPPIMQPQQPPVMQPPRPQLPTPALHMPPQQALNMGLTAARPAVPVPNPGGAPTVVGSAAVLARPTITTGAVLPSAAAAASMGLPGFAAQVGAALARPAATAGGTGLPGVAVQAGAAPARPAAAGGAVPSAAAGSGVAPMQLGP